MEAFSSVFFGLCFMYPEKEAYERAVKMLQVELYIGTPESEWEE